MAAKPPPNNAGCMIPMGVLFALFGIVFAYAALTGSKGYESPDQKRMGAIVSLAVVAIGAGLIVAGRAATKTASKAQATAAQAPGKPWLWREDWAQGYAKPDWRSEANVRGLVGLLVLLISSACLAAAFRQTPKGWKYGLLIGLLIALLFPLAGLFLVGQSLLPRLREAKFRNVRFTFSSLPGVIGGRLGGRVESAFLLPSGVPASLVLSCVRSYVSGTGDDRSRWENVLWQAKQTVVPYVGGPGSYLPVDFTIPYDARATDTSNPDDEIFWRLTASALLPGLNFHATFRAPVFKTEASDSAITAERIEATEAARVAGSEPADAKIVTATSAEGGVRFHLGAARNKGVAAAMTLFGIVFLGGGLFFGIAASRPFTWFVGAIPLVISGGVGVGLIAFATWLWFGTTTIDAVNRTLRIRSRCVGFSRTRSVNAAEIQKFELYPGMQSGDHVWYDLRIHLHSGAKITAASAMDKSEAQWFVGELKKDLGV
jgi:hypothetical protein